MVFADIENIGSTCSDGSIPDPGYTGRTDARANSRKTGAAPGRFVRLAATVIPGSGKTAMSCSL